MNARVLRGEAPLWGTRHFRHGLILGGERKSLGIFTPFPYADFMFKKKHFAKTTFLLASGTALISATPPTPAPGNGVLCLGTFIYFVERSGSLCRTDEDQEFQARISAYARRFDDYIIRNTGGDPTVLADFKEGQNLTSEDRNYICEGDVAKSYDRFKATPAEELDNAVEELLANDGPPSFGDCV